MSTDPAFIPAAIPIEPPAAAAPPPSAAPVAAALAGLAQASIDTRSDVLASAVTPAVAISPVVTIDSSAAKGQLTALATGLVRIAGVFLMAHGAMTPATAAAVEPIIVNEIVGTALLVIGQCWAQIREWLSHEKKLSAAFADPSNIVLK